MKFVVQSHQIHALDIENHLSLVHRFLVSLGQFINEHIHQLIADLLFRAYE